VRRTLLRFFSRVQVAVVRLDNMAPWCCAELRDAMRVGNICFSDQFFSTTQTVREVKQILDDELVRHSPHTRPGAPLTCSPVCAAQLLYPRGGALAPRPSSRPYAQPAKTPFGKQKKTYSGKCGGRNDDLVRPAPTPAVRWDDY
jgi:hypothetical protein